MKHVRKKEWFDDDSFWRELYEFMFTAERFAGAAEETEKILNLIQPKGKSVLDLCCGPGRFSIPLAQRGFDVMGVDRTKYLLDKARENAKLAKVKIKWVRQDMRDFERKDSYDLVINMLTSFGYFDNKSEDIRVLLNAFSSLRPGGKYLIDLLGKELIAKIMQPTTSEVLANGDRLFRRHEIFDDWTRMRNEWNLIRNGTVTTYCFHHTLSSGQELRDRMEKVGFTDVKLYGGLDGSEYGPQAQRLIAVGRKPADPSENDPKRLSIRRKVVKTLGESATASNVSPPASLRVTTIIVLFGWAGQVNENGLVWSG